MATSSGVEIKSLSPWRPRKAKWRPRGKMGNLGVILGGILGEKIPAKWRAGIVATGQPVRWPFDWDRNRPSVGPGGVQSDR